jgi:hypothetical protein
MVIKKKVTDTFLMPSKQICLLKTSVLRPPAAGGRCGGVSQKKVSVTVLTAGVPEIVIKKKGQKKVTDTFLMPSRQICLLKPSVAGAARLRRAVRRVSQKWCQSPFAASVQEMVSGAEKRKKGD